MAYRPKIKNANGTLTDLPIAAETAVKADDYNTSTGTIKTKFATVDSKLGKLQIDGTWYTVKEETNYTATGTAGYITIIK
jgi:hypothetical protein|nr:MAG TPA: hypothetical protein [Caudoviricetes sp.]